MDHALGNGSFSATFDFPGELAEPTAARRHRLSSGREPGFTRAARRQAAPLENFVLDPRLDREKTSTPGQREVLQLLAEGRNMRDAAATFNISARTVAFRKYQIMEEHGLKTHQIW
jgi:DNA-binding NarL/FixJ family response regulator